MLEGQVSKLDSLLDKQGEFILRVLQKECIDVTHGTYYLTCLTHDVMKMLFSIMSRNMPQQEAKAAYKIALDSVLLNYGLSVNIHEFN